MELKIDNKQDREAVALVLIRNGYTVKIARIDGGNGKKTVKLIYDEK